MLGLFRRMMKNRKGFTLIELMVVVVIIGVLATLAIQQLGDQSDKAKLAKIKADLKTLSSAAEIYKIDKGSYPSSISALETEKYIKKVPTVPAGSDFQGKNYYINSTSGNAVLGTDADNPMTYSGFQCTSASL